MKTLKILAIAAATGALAAAGAATAQPPHGTPPGLAKKPYGMPPGQAKKMYDYRVGAHLPRNYYTNRAYYVRDYDRYNLRVAPPGYQWVRVGNDVYLTQTRTGLIAQVIADLFN